MLEYFKCYRNSLQALPAPLSPNLEVLDCHFNDLHVLPALVPGRSHTLRAGLDLLSAPPPRLKLLYCNHSKLIALPTLRASLGN